MGLSSRGSMKILGNVEKGDAPNTIEKRLGPMFFLTPAVATKYQVIF